MIKHKKKTKHKKKRSLTWRIGIFFLKILPFIILLLGGYYYFLDRKMNSRLSTEIWILPTEVYSRIPEIKVAGNLNIQQTLKLLKEHNYTVAKQIVTPGDMVVDPVYDRITIYKRAFQFPENNEKTRLLRISFTNDQISKIEDLTAGKIKKSFQLEPKLVELIQSNNEDRLFLKLNEYPRLLIETLLLTEDKNFYSHVGVNPSSIVRALYTNYVAGSRQQGGSTITQQLAKNLFLSRDKSYIRKFNEINLSVLLELKYPKNKILELYLNEVYLGQHGDKAINGFALASQFYFGRPIQEITLDQMALLVSLVKGPSFYNPWRYPQRALARRNLVLSILKNNGMLDDRLYKILTSKPLGIKDKPGFNKKYPAFIQAVRREFNAQDLQNMRIFTTLDSKVQANLVKVVRQQLPKIAKQYKEKNLETAMVAIDYRTGSIRGIVSGADPTYAGFNRALDARRQIGSLVKPSIYLTALLQPNRYNLNTRLSNKPLKILLNNKKYWRPKNYANTYSESVTLQEALVRSLNIPTVVLGLQLGIDNIIKQQQQMGWDKIWIPHQPSMLLGTYSISPLEASKVFQVIANQGERIDLSTIDAVTNLEGDTLFNREIKSKVVATPEATQLMLYAMQQVMQVGTGRSIDAKWKAYNFAGKTGTSNNNKDSWFVGIDGDNIIMTWVGKDNFTKTKLTGASGALSLYKAYLELANPSPLNVQSYHTRIEQAPIHITTPMQPSTIVTKPKKEEPKVVKEVEEPEEVLPSVWDALDL